MITTSWIHDSHVTLDLLQVVMLVLILIFAGVHSGLASFRDTGEKLIGERAYRVLFAGTSLPLALTTIVSSYTFLYPQYTCISSPI